VDYLAPNAQTPPFDDLHCRLAVAYAIDRAVLAGNVRQGTARQTYAVVPKGMLGYYAGRDSPHYDLGRARSELAMCPDRTAPFALTYPSGAMSANVPPAIVGMLRQAGMNAMVKAVPFTQWIDTVSRPLAETNTQLVWDSWFGNFPDPAQYCSALLRSGEQFSITGWKSPTFDSLVDRADRELNPTIRAGLYIKAQHLAIGEGVWITLDNQRSFGLIKSYVHGLVGSGALNTIVPKGGDWTKVWIGRR
jgi:ABC-type transport system substrate-binding protein